jgi:hypothetical protein
LRRPSDEAPYICGFQAVRDIGRHACLSKSVVGSRVRWEHLKLCGVGTDDVVLRRRESGARLPTT